jgi:gas vesicle protein
MKKFLYFILGFLTGGLLSAGAVLLFTPLSGENVRIEISNYTKNLSNEVQLAAKQKREELEAQLVQLKKPQP